MSDRIPMTKVGYDKLKTEVDRFELEEMPEIAKRTITLFAATKTYNIPGLSCAAAVIPDAQLRASFQAKQQGLVSGVGPLNHIASEACFNDR